MNAHAERIAYSSRETLAFTYACAETHRGDNGVYVECGVAAGAQIIAMADAAPDKVIYAFDSFEGIPMPSNRDDQMPGIKFLTDYEIQNLPNPGDNELISSGATVVSEDDFKLNLSMSKVNTENVKIVKGWFEQTVPLFASLSPDIALLRLDGDLYNSTYVCLRYLFPKVIEYGTVIIDDWNLKGCREACDDYFHLIGYKPDYKFISDIAYFIK